MNDWLVVKIHADEYKLQYRGVLWHENTHKNINIKSLNLIYPIFKEVNQSVMYSYK